MKIDRIFYINSDIRTDKRKRIEDEFTKMDIVSHEHPNPNNKLTFERFSTTERDTICGLGCGKSHIGVLKLSKQRDYSTVIILQDDFVFTVSKEEFHKTLEYMNCAYLDVCILTDNLLNYKNSIVLPHMYRLFKTHTTSGYLMNCRYIDVLVGCFQTAVDNHERTNNHILYDIGIAWNQLQLTDPWYALKKPIGKSNR